MQCINNCDTHTHTHTPLIYCCQLMLHLYFVGAPPGTTLDPMTKVIEFSVVGVGLSKVIQFNIVNPTGQDYTFCWVCEDDPSPKIPHDFTNILKETDNGFLIKSGKKYECGFEFKSSQLGLVESFWKFLIPELDITVPFLLVGDTRDPSITLDKSHLNYKSLLIGDCILMYRF